MNGFRRNAAGLVAMATVALAAACGGNPTGPDGDDRGTVTVTGITVQGAATVERGQTSQLQAMAQRSDGSSQDVSAQAAWRSSNPAVATISATGLLTAVTAGTVDISADFSGQSGRRTVTVSAGAWTVRVTLTSLVVVESCDDFTQGLTDAELAYKIGIVQTDGRESVLADTGYPGSAQGDRLSGVSRIRQGEVVNLANARDFRLPGEDGQFVRVEFRATEWDEQIVLIPPSVRWVRDDRMNDRLGSRTHRFSGNAWSGLGNNTLTLGGSGCLVRLDYRVSAER